MEQVQRRIGTVKRWHHSPQRHRWMALALLGAETRMRRLTGYRHLPKLKHALKEAVPDREGAVGDELLFSLLQLRLHTCLGSRDHS